MITIPAVFENGVFKPNAPVDLPSGAKVDLIVSESQDDPVAIMKARYPQSFGCMPAEDADEMLHIIDEEFGRVNPDEWR
jgi:predicted DNA-binding antitoxin AbrB/MazE fold protein